MIPILVFVGICALLIWVGSHKTKEERDYERALGVQDNHPTEQTLKTDQPK